MSVLKRIAEALEALVSVQRDRLAVEKEELAALQQIAAEVAPQGPGTSGTVVSQQINFGAVLKK